MHGRLTGTKPTGGKVKGAEFQRVCQVVAGVTNLPKRLPSPGSVWYNCRVAIDFGTGPTLKDFCPGLRDDAERHAQILRVTERNSVIEGLPPFQEETRRRIAEQLGAMASAQRQEPRE